MYLLAELVINYKSTNYVTVFAYYKKYLLFLGYLARRIVNLTEIMSSHFIRRAQMIAILKGLT